jgi:hypothetical protein
VASTFFLAFALRGINGGWIMVSLESEKAKKQGKVDREQLLAAIRAAVEAEGGGTLTYRKFMAVSKISYRTLVGLFPKWSDALRAAGVVCRRNNKPIDDSALLKDWAQVARKLGRVPTLAEYGGLGHYCYATMTKRFGGLLGIIDAFRDFAGDEREWADVLALLSIDSPGRCLAKAQAWKRVPRAARAGKGLQAGGEKSPVCGEPIYQEAMSHAPMNECGVILLFGAMAKRLGFTVESLRAGFPDCQAKRRIGPGFWQNVRIEFEYESRNFRIHGHLPDACDLIVCWEHNWAECPKELGVIALKDEVARLAAARRE